MQRDEQDKDDGDSRHQPEPGSARPVVAVERRVGAPFDEPAGLAYAAGKGYQLSHSLIAFGRGELTGQGLGDSIEKLHYLPEAHTDFVFSVFSEEFGFAGASVVLALFAILLWRMLRTAARSGDPRARILVGAVSAWIWFQLFENIAMAVGIAPVTGLALPFVSYGGSSMVSLGAALGLVQSVHVSSRPQYE